MNLSVPSSGKEIPLVDVRAGSFGVRGTGDTSGFGGLVRRIELPAAAMRPLSGWFEDVVASLEIALQKQEINPDAAIERLVVAFDELTIFIQREHLSKVMRTLRD